MNIIDLRKGLRRSPTGQRKEDRRKVPYEFGSPEWLDYIKNNHLECPQFDRRKGERRNEKRRLPDRRQQQIAEPVNYENKYARILLTPSERRLLEDLYLNDLD